VSSFLSELGGITAGVGAEGLAFAAGFAASHALEPEAITIRQDAWHAAQVRRLDAMIAAAIASENIAAYDTMQAEATYSGTEASRFAYLYHLNLVAPGTGELLSMLRRGTINPGNFTHGLRKNKYEPMWDDALKELETVRLSPAELALGIVRSVVRDPGLLVVTLDTDGSTIPKYPQWPGDVLAEAKAGGIDKDRLRALVGEVGLPGSPQQMASAVFRKIINRPAFNLAILEGDIRPEYADAIFEQAREIPTLGQMMEHALRGFEDVASAQTNAERHGTKAEDSQLVYDNLGRAPSVHTVLVGLRRGGVYDGPTDQIPKVYIEAMRRSNLRPEWFNIAYAARQTYPSAFVIRALLTGGAITKARGDDLFNKIGWPEDLATEVADFYGVATATKPDPHVTKADNQLWTAQHTAYVKDRSDDAFATETLTQLGAAAAAIPTVLARWGREREIQRAGLSAAQIKKAYTEATFTKDEATARLVELGWSAADAGVYLGE
jgi:hypothetical protein